MEVGTHRPCRVVLAQLHCAGMWGVRYRRSVRRRLIVHLRQEQLSLRFVAARTGVGLPLVALLLLVLGIMSDGFAGCKWVILTA